MTFLKLFSDKKLPSNHFFQKFVFPKFVLDIKIGLFLLTLPLIVDWSLDSEFLLYAHLQLAGYLLIIHNIRALFSLWRGDLYVGAVRRSVVP